MTSDKPKGGLRNWLRWYWRFCKAMAIWLQCMPVAIFNGRESNRRYLAMKAVLAEMR